NLEEYELTKAEVWLVEHSPAGRSNSLDKDKIEWFEGKLQTKNAADLAKIHGEGIIKLVERNLPALRGHLDKKAALAEGFMIYEMPLDIIPDENVKEAGIVAAVATAKNKKSVDKTRLRHDELSATLAALRADHGSKLRDELLETNREMHGVAYHGEHEPHAVELLRSQLEVLDDFMREDNNCLLRSGFALLEVGNWRVKRTATKMAAGFFQLPDLDGSMQYSISTMAQATKIHEKYKKDLEDTGFNAVTFMHGGRVWAALVPYGDLEALKEDRTTIPLFDAKMNPIEDSVAEVVGIVDPRTSSPGEAFWRTTRDVARALASKATSSLDPEKRGQDLAGKLQKNDTTLQKASFLTALGLGVSAVKPLAALGAVGFAVAPGGLGLLKYSATSMQLRPLYERMGMTVIGGKKFKRTGQFRRKLRGMIGG
ncbi:hypothetical protein ACFL6C_11250, partial [Myxococcota bacterium]